MSNFNTNTKNNDEWLTPPSLTDSLGVFDLDPCQPINPPFLHAVSGFNVNDDGLSQDWNKFKRIWCNPPYGRETFKWLNKLHDHGNGIALIFARTETKGFHSEVWDKCDAIFFFKGRIKFHYVTGEQGDSANAPSCLVIYGKANVEHVRNSGLSGKLIINTKELKK